MEQEAPPVGSGSWLVFAAELDASDRLSFQSGSA